MVELSTPIANFLSTNLILLQLLTFGFELDAVEHLEKDVIEKETSKALLRTKTNIKIDPLKERPGLQSIIYTAIHDQLNYAKSLQKISERALL